MNAGASSRIQNAQDFINALEQFQKKCDNKTLKSNDIDQFAEVISNTPRPKLDQSVLSHLNKLKGKIGGTTKGEIEKIAGSQPYQNLIIKIDDLSRYLKEEKESQAKVGRKGNEGLPKR